MAKLTCGVPNLSIRGTRCRGAYLASSLFILTSSLSPSAFTTHKAKRGARESAPPQLWKTSLHAARPRHSTFDVNSGQDVLEGGGVEQVAHFFLGLRFKHNARGGHFASGVTRAASKL